MKWLLKAKPVLHGVAILISAVVSGITALQMGGDVVTGAVVGAGVNSAVALVTNT